MLCCRRLRLWMSSYPNFMRILFVNRTMKYQTRREKFWRNWSTCVVHWCSVWMLNWFFSSAANREILLQRGGKVCEKFKSFKSPQLQHLTKEFVFLRRWPSETTVIYITRAKDFKYNQQHAGEGVTKQNVVCAFLQRLLEKIGKFLSRIKFGKKKKTLEEATEKSREL